MTLLGWHFIVVFLLCLANLGLGFFVFLHDRRAPANKIFLLTVLVVTGWLASISIALSVASPALTVRLGRMAFAFAATMPFVLLNLFLAFSPRPFPLHKLMLPALACGAFVALSFSDLIVSGSLSGALGPNFVYGPLHRALGIYVLACFLYALAVAWFQIRSLSGMARLQLRYLFVGAMLSGSGIVATNLLIPLVWNTSRYSVIGPYFTLVFLAFSAHAIVRHRLLDIRLVVRRGVVYILAIALTSTLFLFLGFIAQRIAGNSSATIPISVALAIAILVATFFQPIKDWLQQCLNHYVYRPSYDYHQILTEASRHLSTLLDLHPLLAYLLEVIDVSLSPELSAVYLAESATHDFSLVVKRTTTPAQPPLTIARASMLSVLLHEHPRPIDLEEHLRYSDVRSEIQGLRSLGVEVALPLLLDGKLSGIILLGVKRSGDPFFADDLDVVASLVSQAAIAINNAQLYQQVLLANEYVENILRTMDSAVVAIDSNGAITLFNASAERLTGLQAAHVKGSPAEALPSAIATALQSTRITGTNQPQVEAMLRRSQGDALPVIYSTSPLRDPVGSVRGAVAVFNDLTRLKTLETENRRVERLASLGAFASRIAHEVKNPLVAIKTFAELLPERFPDADFRLDFSQVVTREIDRIDGLIQRLRGLDTTDSKHFSHIDLRDPIEDTLSLLQGQLQQASISLSTCLPNHVAPILGDVDQLKQLFLNVLLNAIQAMPSGGHLSVALHTHNMAERGIILVEVKDSGIGIAQELLPTIFDPFVTTKTHGSGLGLAICKGIATAHGATFLVTNNSLGPGARVVLEFPVAGSLQHPTTNAVSVVHNESD